MDICQIDFFQKRAWQCTRHIYQKGSFEFGVNSETGSQLLKKSMSYLLIGVTKKSGITGLSEAFEMLICQLEKMSISHQILDLGEGGFSGKVGGFRLSRAWFCIKAYFNFLYKVRDVDAVYLTISTSIFGFLRDACFIWTAKLFRKKVILHLHGAGYAAFFTNSHFLLKLLIIHTLKLAHRIIVLGEMLKKQFHFVPNIAKSLKVVPNGLPLANNDFICKTLPLNSKGIRILFMSHMSLSKGYMILLEACHILMKQKQIPVTCNFCGGFLQYSVDDNVSPDQAKVSFFSKIREWGLEEHVKYWGIVSGQTKIDLLKNSDVFVLPTFHPWEGQPISIIEAMAFGLPTIATSVGGIPEQVIHQYNGFIVEQKSPQQIADACELLWKDKSLYSRMSQGAIDHYNKYFTAEIHLKKMLEVFHEV